MRAATRRRPALQTRLLVIDPAAETYRDRTIDAFPELLGPGDLVVVNDAATIPASLAATFDGVPIELRLTRPPDPILHAVVFGAGDWRTRTEDRPAPPALRVRDLIRIGDREARVLRAAGRLVELSIENPWDLIYRHGRPVQYSYLATDLALADAQTPYATRPWAVEMPSAGRPLTPSTFLALRARGVAIATLTHAAGLSSTGDAALDAALPWPERYEIPEATLRMLDRARRVIAIGTTVVRALESYARSGEASAETNLVLDRDTAPRIVDGLLTTMHEPDESHYRLLLAFAPPDLLARAHAHADREGYLAHELGDATLVLGDVLI